MLDDEERRAAAAAALERSLKEDGAARTLPAGAASSEVCMRDVSFSYPREDSPVTQPVLEGINLDLTAERVKALVGPSGSGKSTVLRLLLRFYSASSGSITFGGTPIDALPNDWLRAHVCVVEQEPTLFRASIHDNIAFGVPLPSTAEGGGLEAASPEALTRSVVAAARAANAHDFILEAGGYEASVGEHGATLSGGQRQRIAIARALLRQPSVLLLDEATASLDAKSEQLVQQALAHLTVGRATLVVAHRLSTIRSADEILVLEHGRVVERGTHNELVDAGALYTHLSALQHLDKTDAAE